VIIDVSEVKTYEAPNHGVFWLPYAYQMNLDSSFSMHYANGDGLISTTSDGITFNVRTFDFSLFGASTSRDEDINTTSNVGADMTLVGLTSSKCDYYNSGLIDVGSYSLGIDVLSDGVMYVSPSSLSLILNNGDVDNLTAKVDDDILFTLSVGPVGDITFILSPLPVQTGHYSIKFVSNHHITNSYEGRITVYVLH